MSSILVTGALGFIATNLIEELLKTRSNNIVGIDNFYSGTKENLNFIKSIDKSNKFNFIKADIRDFESINKIVKEKKIEQIYHLAAIACVQESIKNPLLSNDVNAQGTLNILEASRLNGVKKVVFSSSAAVYGNEPTLPKCENSILKPISPYGYQKLISEQYLKLYSELYGVKTVSLRYFNVYGKRQNVNNDYSGVISIFDYKFKNNQLPLIYGDGEQYRDFIHVKDVVAVNIKAMNTPELINGVICVGTGEKTSINDLFNFLNKKYRQNFKPVYAKSNIGDIKESICDNSKLKKVLNFNTFVKFENGISEL